MSGGSRYEYFWADGKDYKKPTALPAPKYIENLIDWVEGQINNEEIFPITTDIPWVIHWLATLRYENLMKNMFTASHARSNRSARKSWPGSSVCSYTFTFIILIGNFSYSGALTNASQIKSKSITTSLPQDCCYRCRASRQYVLQAFPLFCDRIRVASCEGDGAVGWTCEANLLGLGRTLIVNNNQNVWRQPGALAPGGTNETAPELDA